MKPKQVYERRQAAEQMEALLVILSAIGAIAAVFAFLCYGWWPGLALFLLSGIAFALSRVFELLAELLAWAGRFEERKKPNRPEQGNNPGS